MSADPENPTGRSGDAGRVTSPASRTSSEAEHDTGNEVDPGVDTDAETGPVARSRAARLGAWLGEVPSSQSPPFSKYRWLRLLTYLVVFYLALGIAGAGTEELSDDYGFTLAVALPSALLQGLAILLALWRPVPAWALSLAAAVATALLARQNIATMRLSSPNWPWSPPVLIAHMAVILLLALRVRPRGTVAAFAATALATFVVEGGIGALYYSPTGPAALALFAVAAVIGVALRSRSVARTELVQQTTITAEERARRTLLEERSRIARELHDVVAHHMSVISIQAQVAPHLVENPSDELKENLTGIRNNALEALTELRRVLGVLRSESPDEPEAVEDSPGVSAPGTGAAPHAPQPNLARLDSLLENTRAAGLDVVKAEEGDPHGYSPGVELSAYRIVQEALSNVLRHAPGAKVRVDIAHLPGGIYLSVSNSRPSRPVPPSPGSGHGLLGMRERAAMLGGQVEAKPSRTGGFVVTAFLPRGAAPEPPEPSPPSPS
ncbi:sensor histidine kinase [Streptomyces alanosinicus]|uniref:histidine kinase n=1 Tax=Streptomyces alanosinicus TaxID=68171 RepID=A0A919D6E5_9ACTN|nr:histidine kinase [Streptomyces alanosinicus]GHE10547.1 two-component sensor histidine kinase [Streptomyces alanosinicus]